LRGVYVRLGWEQKEIDGNKMILMGYWWEQEEFDGNYLRTWWEQKEFDQLLMGTKRNLMRTQ
jgi:hypothetical protein